MPSIKRGFALLLCAALLLALFAPALAAGEGAAAFTVSSAEAAPGEEVSLLLSLEENPGLIAAALELDYDGEKLELLAVEDAKLLPNGVFSDSLDTFPFVMMWEASTAAENLTQTGTLARLSFRVREGSAGTARVGLRCDPENVYDYDVMNVPFTLGEGEVRITGGEHEHRWSTPAYAWAADHTSCTASRACEDCGAEETETAAAEQTEEDGRAVFTVRFANPAFSEQRWAAPDESERHHWGEVSYQWNDSACTASRTCLDEGCGRVDAETVNAVLSVTTEPGCESEGSGVYTAIFRGGAFRTQRLETTLPPAGHRWGEPVYEWQTGHATCSARAGCTVCGAVVTETAASVHESETAFCERPGCESWRVSFLNDAFAPQEYREETPALEHEWARPLAVWNEDHSLCTGQVDCARCGKRLTETAEARLTVTKEPSCTETGEALCTAVFANELLPAQEETAELPALGHDFVSEEGAAERRCSRCGLVETSPGGEEPPTPTPTLVLSQASAKTGEEVALTLRLENNPGLISLLAQLHYDRSRLQLLAAEDAGLLPNATFSDRPEADPFILYWEDATAAEDCREEGVLVTLRFRVLVEAAAGEAEVSLSYDPEDIYNAAMENVAFAVEAGAVRVEQSGQDPGPGTDPGTQPPAEHKTIRAAFRLIGDSLHDGGCAGHETYVTWIPTTWYALEEGDTAYTLFMLALADAGLSQTGAERSFVDTITAPAVLGGFVLGGGDNGSVSGWMYTVNGKHPQVTLQDFILADGDVVVWHYCDDYTQEENPGAPYYARWLEAADIPPEEYLLSQGGPEPVTPAEPEPGPAQPPEETAAPAFADVKEGDWFFADAAWCAAKGLMEGVGEDRFAPEGAATRAMLVTVLYRLAGSPEAGESTFADVPAGAWFAPAVAWAEANGVVEGYGQGRFGPGDPLTREQLVTVLWRCALFMGHDAAAADSLEAFADRETASAYALPALRWAVAAGLLQGRGTGRLAPREGCTRAELAAFLHRFCELKA